MKEIKFNDASFFRPITGHYADISKELDMIVPLDYAPDGMKRFLDIKRSKELDLADRIARYLSLEENELPLAILSKIDAIENYVRTEILMKDLIELDDPELNGQFFIPNNPLIYILPDTLLTNILGRGSKLDLLYEEMRRYYNRSDSRTIQTSALSAIGDEDFQKARKEVEKKKYLALSLTDNSVKVIGIDDNENLAGIKYLNDLISEDIFLYRPNILLKQYDKIIDKFIYDEYKYKTALLADANEYEYSVYVEINRQDVLSAFTTILAQLNKLHKSGYVHGDLKPQNILSLKDKLISFDALNVRIGEISAGLTADFCAPEQILTKPVSPATDIYNIGLILASIIDCVVYGKTSNYVIPTGNTKVKVIRLLTEPGIYIDPENGNIQNAKGIPAWISLLRKCLAFDQNERYLNVEDLISDLNTLMRKYPLKNSIEIRPNFGNLSIIQEGEELEPAWFLKI